MTNRKLLMVAHEFPPISGARVMRATKFAKYLPEYGWFPIVLTANPYDCYYRHEWTLDLSLSAELEGQVLVYRIPSPLERQARRLMRKLKRVDRKGGVVQFKDEGITHSKLGKALRRLHVQQDQSGLWIPYAYRAAMRLLRREEVDAVLTTSPPHLIQLVGWGLKIRTGKPWIADFRDGWSDNVLFQAESRLRQRLDRRLESIVINRADAKLVVTRHMLATFQQAYPNQAGSFHLIRNGFDPADFQNISPDKDTDVITFVYVGNITDQRAAPLLQAFHEILAAGHLQPEKVKVQFVGNLFVQALTQLPEWVEIVPPVSHQEAIKWMVNAGVLMLVIAIEEGRASFGSKVFEYLASRRPILAVVPPVGELAELLTSLPGVIVASPANVEEIKTGILRAFDLAVAHPHFIEVNSKLIEAFDRRVQAGQLADLLNSLTVGRP